MQRVSNQDRTERMRRTLLDVARTLFVEKGYAQTSTPEIVAAAGVTRGALYHHFADKQAIFRAVVESEAAAVAVAIEAHAQDAADARGALRAGTRAYLEAMRVPGRTRLLLIEGPAVLGGALLSSLDAEHAARTLREGIEAARAQSAAASAIPAAVLAELLSAAFDRAAIAIEGGAKPETFLEAMDEMIARLV